MDNDLIHEAEEIVSKALEKEKLVEDALEITKCMHDEYIGELKDLWNESEADLLYSLMELKSISEKIKMLGINPKSFYGDVKVDTKTRELLDEFFKTLPNRKSANVAALEDIYENGSDPYLYGKSDDVKRKL